MKQIQNSGGENHFYSCYFEDRGGKMLNADCDIVV